MNRPQPWIHKFFIQILASVGSVELQAAFYRHDKIETQNYMLCFTSFSRLSTKVWIMKNTVPGTENSYSPVVATQYYEREDILSFSYSSKHVDNNFNFTWQKFDFFVVFMQKETKLSKIITQA